MRAGRTTSNGLPRSWCIALRHTMRSAVPLADLVEQHHAARMRECGQRFLRGSGALTRDFRAGPSAEGSGGRADLRCSVCACLSRRRVQHLDVGLVVTCDCCEQRQRACGGNVASRSLLERPRRASTRDSRPLPARQDAPRCGPVRSRARTRASARGPTAEAVRRRARRVQRLGVRVRRRPPAGSHRCRRRVCVIASSRPAAKLSSYAQRLVDGAIDLDAMPQ